MPLSHWRSTPRTSRFQSTPPVAEGRCHSPGRAIRCPGKSFNPRPPLPRGDAPVAPRLERRYMQVSIHAPRCRGAMPTIGIHIPQGITGFNPRPPVAEGRCRGRGCRGSGAVRCFNPRPPLPSGDADNAGHPWSGVADCFNPRPPLPRGDAGAAPREARSVARFQSTPPRGDARHNHSLTSIPTIVSIHAPRCRGAMP